MSTGASFHAVSGRDIFGHGLVFSLKRPFVLTWSATAPLKRSVSLTMGNLEIRYPCHIPTYGHSVISIATIIWEFITN